MTVGMFSRVVKPADEDARAVSNNRGPRMHGSKGERNLMAGHGSLIRWSGERVQVTGEKPGSGRPDGRAR